MKYYLIYNSDGDTSVCEYDRDKLLAEIEDKAWGEEPVFLDKLPGRDTNYWRGMLIIKGEIVTLKKKEVITKYDLD